MRYLYILIRHFAKSLENQIFLWTTWSWIFVYFSCPGTSLPEFGPKQTFICSNKPSIEQKQMTITSQSQVIANQQHKHLHKLRHKTWSSHLGFWRMSTEPFKFENFTLQYWIKTEDRKNLLLFWAWRRMVWSRSRSDLSQGWRRVRTGSGPVLDRLQTDRDYRDAVYLRVVL